MADFQLIMFILLCISYKIVDMFNENHLSCAILDTMLYIVISSQKELPSDREIQGKVTGSLE